MHRVISSRILNYLTLSLDVLLSTRIPALKSSDSFFYGNSRADWTDDDIHIRMRQFFVSKRILSRGESGRSGVGKMKGLEVSRLDRPLSVELSEFFFPRSNTFYESKTFIAIFNKSIIFMRFDVWSIMNPKLVLKLWFLESWKNFCIGFHFYLLFFNWP